MFHITSSLLGGLAAVAAWALVVAPSPDSGATASRDTPAQVNRADKNDRLASPRLNRADPAAVATVEVIGVHDAAIVYRDRDGRVLFQTDPMSNVTVISKGFVLPQLTVRETSHSTPVPIEAPRAPPVPKPAAIPIGCEPLESPIMQPGVSPLPGRCLSLNDAAGARPG